MPETTITFSCDWCGKEAEQREYHYKTTENHFCSRSCTNSWQARDTPRKTCETCGETYKVQPYHAENSRFCSAECRDNRPQGKPKVGMECKYCGADYEVYPSQAPRSSFCSQECQLDWLHETFQGENHENFVDGVARSYGPEWGDIRKDILGRDNHRCVICGAEEHEAYRLNVHHIVPYRKFDTDEEAHSEDNLITLCSSCHGKYEGIPLDVEGLSADYSDFS